MLVVTVGVPGVGKTHVINRALERLKSENITYQTINYGDVMLEIAKSKGFAKDRDEMRKLNPELQMEVQKLSAQKIAAMSREKNFLLDTHGTIKTKRGFLPGLPEWVLHELKPDRMIIVEASIEDIIARRNKDQNTIRNRDSESEEEIILQQQLNRMIAMAYSVFTGMTIKIVDSSDGNQENAIADVIEVLK